MDTDKTIILLTNEKYSKYQPYGKGDTHLPPAMPHHLKTPKWPQGRSKMADGVLKEV